MKKTLIILIILLIIAAFVLLVYPYHIKRVCFGDLCPQNGGMYLLYTHPYNKEECLGKGAYPVEGIGWGPVYAGCSPVKDALSR